MTLSISKIAYGLLVVALATPSTLVCAATEEGGASAPAPAGIRVSMARASDSLAVSERAASLAMAKAGEFQPSNANVPLTPPRQSRANKSMGAGMMIMSLVGTAAGIAGTYYMIKTMKDQTKTKPGE